MDQEQLSGQSNQSIEKNINFFRDNLDSYNDNVQKLDSYVNIRSHVNQSIKGIDNLLDIGNGGVFDYDTDLVGQITALDLFLDKMPDSFSCPKNVILKQGSALDIPQTNNLFDGVLMVMLIHHLVGKTVQASIENVQQSIKEAHRVLKPGGKFIIAESCIPNWFYGFEKMVYPLASWIITKTIDHPPALQYPATVLQQMLEKEFHDVQITDVPLGKWVLFLGFKIPTFITPVRVKIFTATKKNV